MNYIEIFNILGPAWYKLDMYIINGVPHWAGYQIIVLLGLSSTTWTFRGRKDNPKMGPPLYKMCRVRKINKKRTIYLVTIDGIYRAIMKTKKCKPFRIKLRQHGIMI
jgi:hypothetical protein